MGWKIPWKANSTKGHFDGVGTVLNLLFRAIRPDKAYFGEKDFQQLQVVRKLVQLEKLPVEIVGCPISREPHGLAMSSRNNKLSDTQFEEAGLITRPWKKFSINSTNTALQSSRIGYKNNFQKRPSGVGVFWNCHCQNPETCSAKRLETLIGAFIAVLQAKCGW